MAELVENDAFGRVKLLVVIPFGNFGIIEETGIIFRDAIVIGALHRAPRPPEMKERRWPARQYLIVV